ncbi:MAG: YlxR family protein [Chloroflexota bacterium]|nr:YlxR family protein [Chloroflexota bacterium]
MTRLVRHADGSVTADPTGKAPGRGTYVCDQAACREPRRLTEGVQRAFGGSVVAELLLSEAGNASA